MNPRTTGILVLLAAALGAFVYFYEIRGEQTRSEAKEREKRLFSDVEPAAIDWIEVTLADAPPARVERKDGKWRVVAPLEFPADAATADSLASTLATLASETVLEDPQPPEEYGLGAGARVVRFSAGGKEHTLRLGKDAPVGGGSYASAEGSAVYTVTRFKATSLAKRADDLRDKRVLDFEAASVQRVEASWPDGRVVLEREAPAADAKDAKDAKDAAPPPAPPTWRIVEPIQGRADNEVISDLLSDLSFLHADGFVDAPPPDTEDGLAHPEFQLALTLPGSGEGAESRVVHLAIGPKREGDVRWARGAQPAILYVLPAKALDDLPRKLVAYRWKQLSGFSAAEAQSMDFFFQPQSGDPVAIHATRDANRWSASPEPFADGKLDAALAELSRLRASDIAADSMGEAELRKLGLAPPNAIITVFGKAADETKPADAAKPGASGASDATKPAPVLAEVQLGNVVGSEWIAARAAGDPTVYKLPYNLADQLPVSLDAFRNRFRKSDTPEADAQKPPEAAPRPPDGEDFPSPSEESP